MFTEFNNPIQSSYPMPVYFSIWSTQMKAWLWNFLYPLNLWRACLACCHWVLRTYQKWLWDPLLEKWLSFDPEEAAENKHSQFRLYTCVQCGSKKRIALIVQKDVEASYFCSVTCRNEYALSAAVPCNSDRVQQPAKT